MGIASWIIPISTLISSIGVVVTLFLTFLKPGRIRVLRPGRLTLLKVKTKEAKKDALIIPFTVSNPSSFDKNVILCIVVRIINESRKTTEPFTQGRPVSVFTNDFEIDLFSYTELRNRSDSEWASDKLDLHYITSFVTNSRSSSHKDCVFLPIDKLLSSPFTDNPDKRVELDVYVRKDKYLSRKKMEKVRSELRESRSTYGDDFIHSEGVKSSLWKPAFRINWRTPEETTMYRIKEGAAHTVTRFESAKIHLWERALHKVPLLLLSEET